MDNRITLNTEQRNRGTEKDASGYVMVYQTPRHESFWGLDRKDSRVLVIK